MKFILSFFLLILFISCAQQKKIIFGYYENKRPCLIEQGWFVVNGIGSYSLGGNLELKEDSTFVYITCGNIMNGKWVATRDSVFLFIESNRWRKDSLENLGYSANPPHISPIPIGFKKARYGLVQNSYTKNMKRTINKLSQCDHVP